MSATGPVPEAPTDPRELALHLEICRMQAELEGLEQRIRQVEAAKAAGGSGYDPFVERAEELVERMVSSLYVTGRSEIAAAGVANDEAAEALLDDARQRAQAILSAARDELARALSERAERLAGASEADLVVDLTDSGPEAEHSATEHPATETETEPQAPGPVVTWETAAPISWDIAAVEAALSAPAVPDHAATDESAPPDGADTTAVGAAAVFPPPPPPPPPPPGGATSDQGTALHEMLAPIPPPPGAPRGLTGPNLPPLPPLEVVPPAPPAGPSTEPVDAPAAEEADGPAGSPVEVETARTDAAFNAWMAVGPDLVHDDQEAGSPPRARKGWVRPIEVALALAVVAAVILVAILLFG